jgi:hypothetical protein
VVLLRKRPSKGVEHEICRRSGRRCCLCFGLYGDLGVKKGQIAHLDRNSGNSSIDNLAFLCLEHHDEYDTITRQSKGFTIQEVKSYREDLYRAIERLHAIRTNNLDVTAMRQLEQFFNEQRKLGAQIARINEKIDFLEKFSVRIDEIDEKNRFYSQCMDRLQE